ncbi:hypothetical protein CK203_113677 [Vitis vinifera]|uniref:Uncharacterized protein n=1 Tax=Vitis vinifera TaxID=29760 RepID=A0A438ECX4_VITVI|nr:hypothetical protein CK203_113677 [Vitis vinifera]
MEEASHFREAMVGLRLAKEVIKAAKIGFFQPKLIINNIDVLRHAILTDDSYYSYQAYLDFGFPDIFISRETFGWTPQEPKLHMVTDYFSHSELAVIADVLGPNPRHLFELYALKQSNYYQKVMEDIGSTFEDIIDAYLSYLQISVVNPATLKLLEKFAVDARSGRIPEDRLRFGAPWRHPPRIDNPTLCSEWTKLQLIDFVQSLLIGQWEDAGFDGGDLERETQAGGLLGGRDRR